MNSSRADRVLHPPSVNVCARIQAHPDRRHLWEALAQTLDLPVEISLHSSHPPSPWDGYKQCLGLIPPDATHLVVLQDDTRVCANFGPSLVRIAQNNPNVPICLFLSEAPRRIAKASLRERGLYYDAHFRINEFCPVVGMLWPVEKAAEFLRWTEENPRRLAHRPPPRSDDSVMGRWCALTHQTVRFTIPSIVEHLGDVPAVKGGDNASTRYKALQFAADGSIYDW